ncbi:MAG: glycosyltransferase, partial [Lachnospiraceae bacterium]|nr:glycosyltransferase [Lachnospiraceae bacterium]
RGIVSHMHEAGLPVEILTTCVKEFTADWSVNFHKPGVTVERGVTIRRFPVRKREDLAGYAKVNDKLMRGEIPLTSREEEIFLTEMVNSPELYAYIREHKAEYGSFVFIPYMFGTTYHGVQECFEKAVMIPCFHDEAYVYLEAFKKVFPRVAGMIHLAEPEAQLARRVYDLSGVKSEALGAGVDSDWAVRIPEADAGKAGAKGYCPERFRDQYGIHDPFLLYAGRKEKGKNIDSLLAMFARYRREHPEKPLKLVLLGGGRVRIPDSVRGDVLDAGFVDLQDKYDAYGASLALCQPSKNESFSIVIMESWLAERPVLVHDGCAVTKNFAKESGGGFAFRDYVDFEAQVSFLYDREDTARAMGALGREYVLRNFTWDIIVEKYRTFLEEIES